MSVDENGPTVRHNPDRSRYEIYDGTQLAGFTTYTLRGDRISFLHTEVAPEFGGRGLARRLVSEELEDARRQGLGVLPFCPYVQKVIAQELETYLDLVPEADRDRFGLPRSVRSSVDPGTKQRSE